MNKQAYLLYPDGRRQYLKDKTCRERPKAIKVLPSQGSNTPTTHKRVKRKRTSLRLIHEPWLTDKYLYIWGDRSREPEKEEDNIRTYIPMDLNREAILRRLRLVIDINDPSSERNEANYTTDVDMLKQEFEY